MATLAQRSMAVPLVRRGVALRRALGVAMPHAILILFSAAILLPLLWVFRVSLTGSRRSGRHRTSTTTP